LQTGLTSTSERANVSKGATPPPCPIAILMNAKKIEVITNNVGIESLKDWYKG
jgi:hypothetical protein